MSVDHYRQTYFRSVEQHQQGGRVIVTHEIDQFPAHAKSVKRTLVSSSERDYRNPAYLSAVKFGMFYDPHWSGFTDHWIDRQPKLWILGDGNGMVNIYTNGIKAEVEQPNQTRLDLSWRLLHVGGGYLGDIEFREPAPHLLPELGERSLELAYYTVISTLDVPPDRVNVYNFDPGMGDDRVAVVVDPREGINLRYIAKQDQPERGFRIADLRQSESGWIFRGESEHPYPKQYESLLAGRARAPMTDQ